MRIPMREAVKRTSFSQPFVLHAVYEYVILYLLYFRKEREAAFSQTQTQKAACPNKPILHDRVTRGN